MIQIASKLTVGQRNAQDGHSISSEFIELTP